MKTGKHLTLKRALVGLDLKNSPLSEPATQADYKRKAGCKVGMDCNRNKTKRTWLDLLTT